MRLLLIIIPILLLLDIDSKGQNSNFTGIWKGAIYANNYPLRVIMHIEYDQANDLYSTIIESPDQNAIINTSSTNISCDSIIIQVPEVGGKFSGKFHSSDSLYGQWEQNGTNSLLNLAKGENKYCVVKKQDPLPPFPYSVKDIEFDNKQDSITLAGTLSIPAKEGKHPAVILISGSGPHDRNAYTLGHKPFLVLADHLTRHNIAVLRFDERGVGKSEGNYASSTTLDFAEDVLSAIEYLTTQDNIDIKRIGLIGHSEGGLIAPIVANESELVRYIVLLAAPALKGKDILIDQNKNILQSMGAPDSTIKKVNTQIQAEINWIINNYKDSLSPDKLFSESLELLSDITPEERRMYGISEYSTKLRIHRYFTPWYNFYLNYDPLPALMNLRCPVLALNGDKDIQVDSKMNLSLIEEQLIKAKVLYMVNELKNINHMLQPSTQGSLKEYALIDQTISDSVLDLISNWIITLNY